MRCFACDCDLSDYESTLRSPTTGEYLDMCAFCLSEAQITPVSYTQGFINYPLEEEENDI